MTEFGGGKTTNSGLSLSGRGAGHTLELRQATVSWQQGLWAEERVSGRRWNLLDEAGCPSVRTHVIPGQGAVRWAEDGVLQKTNI